MKAFLKYMEAALSSDTNVGGVSSQHYLAKMYFKGRVTPKDFKSGFEWELKVYKFT